MRNTVHDNYIVYLLISSITIISTSMCTYISTQSQQNTPRKLPVEFVVVVPSYNNEQWYKKNLDSIVQQTYPYFEIMYVNDCSTDKTRELVEQYREQSPLKDRITLINQPVRGGPLASQYTAIHQCPDHKVIVTVDGDDMLSSPTVLQELAKIYTDKSIWLTYGSYMHATGEYGIFSQPYPPDVIKNNAFRQYGFRCSHLKTFYAKLFKKINKDDLQHQNTFYQAAGDVAFMFPMLEMASRNHFKFIQKPLYIWNNHNPINEHKVQQRNQNFYGIYIAKKQPYEPLESLFD